MPPDPALRKNSMFNPFTGRVYIGGIVSEEQKSALPTILVTLLCVAFTAWAGVIVWFGNAIDSRLTKLQDTMQRVEGEMVQFKLSVVERVTRVEEHVKTAAEK